MDGMPIFKRLGRAASGLFRPAARYPADPRAIFILMLSVFAGATAFLVRAAPDTLEYLLPHWGVILWGVVLMLGSAVTLTGMAKQSVNGIILEQVGSVMVAAATIFYSVLAVWYLGWGVVQTVGIIFAWGIACLIRWAQLQILINSAMRRHEKEMFVARIHSEIEEHVRRERAERLARLERERRRLR